jgi:phenylacetate-CoA ligase
MSSIDSILELFSFDKNRNWPAVFASFDIRMFELLLKERDETFWQEVGWQQASRVFHAAAEQVPAYKDFLRKNGIDHRKIQTRSDFEAVPPTDKENYIRAYPLSERCFGGRVHSKTLVASSSGTTGEPMFWPRSGYQEFEASVMHELLFRNAFRIHERSTLMVIGFPMGVYVSGVATLLPSFLVSQKGYALTIVSAGNNKTEVLRAIRNLHTQYDQVVLIGHPFFIKDVIETGKREGTRWGSMKLCFLFCSEGFSESWRSYLLEQTDGACDRDSAVSVYGSSELLLMGYETPFTLDARKKFESVSSSEQEGIAKSPLAQIFQYIPFFRFLESVNDELLFTSASGIPLIRFNLHDSGRVFSSKTIAERYHGLSEPLWKIPTVSMWGRSDYTVIFYAANIYPEHIKPVLYRPEFIRFCTGNFSMEKGYDANHDEFLEIHIELNSGVEPSEPLALLLQKSIVASLRSVNMEYLFLCNHLEKDLTPRIILWRYRSETYFKAGVKPKYIIDITR